MKRLNGIDGGWRALAVAIIRSGLEEWDYKFFISEHGHMIVDTVGGVVNGLSEATYGFEKAYYKYLQSVHYHPNMSDISILFQRYMKRYITEYDTIDPIVGGYFK